MFKYCLHYNMSQLKLQRIQDSSYQWQFLVGIVNIGGILPHKIPKYAITLTEDPQFYGLEMSLSNILMINLFRLSNRMVIFSKTEYIYIYIYIYHIKNVSSLKLQPILLFEELVSSSTLSYIYFDCIENNPEPPPTHPFLDSTDSMYYSQSMYYFQLAPNFLCDKTLLSGPDPAL